MFIRVSFTSEEIEDFKEQTEKKNKLLNYNNLNKNFETRWTGLASEIGFKQLLDEKQIPYVYHANNKKVDDRDFTIDDFEIDLKAVATSYEPRPYYACNIDNIQWHKIMKEGNIINTLLFARFLLHLNEVVFVGVISKERLKEIAEFFPKGTPRGKIILSTNNWEVPISSLTPVEKFLGI